MNWHKVTDFPGHLDLGEVHQYFAQQGLVHRFTESSGRQELWVAEERRVEEAREFVDAWLNGSVRLERVSEQPGRRRPPPRAAMRGGFIGALKATPFTLVIVVLGIIGFAIVEFLPRSAWLGSLTFERYYGIGRELAGGSALAALAEGEIWRLITPTFLHFNILHIVFNALWIWEFGRRLEHFFSTLAYLLIFFVTAVGANLVQFFTAANVPFGGLSGVVYGYMGVLFVAHRISPSPILAVPPGIFGFMLIWLALGVFGVIDMFMPGSAAVGNGAHLGGLLFGLISGYLLLGRRAAAGR